MGKNDVILGQANSTGVPPDQKSTQNRVSNLSLFKPLKISGYKYFCKNIILVKFDKIYFWKLKISENCKSVFTKNFSKFSLLKISKNTTETNSAEIGSDFNLYFNQVSKKRFKFFWSLFETIITHLSKCPFTHPLKKPILQTSTILNFNFGTRQGKACRARRCEARLGEAR